MIETPRRKRAMHGEILASGKTASACAVAVVRKVEISCQRYVCTNVRSSAGDLETGCVAMNVRGVQVHISLPILNKTTALAYGEYMLPQHARTHTSI